MQWLFHTAFAQRLVFAIHTWYESRKISLNFSVIISADSSLSKLLYLHLEELSNSSECHFFESDEFAYSLHTKGTMHSQHCLVHRFTGYKAGVSLRFLCRRSVGFCSRVFLNLWLSLVHSRSICPVPGL